MEIIHPEFVPDPAASREEMEALQREIAARAVFDDDFDFDVRDLSLRVDERLPGGTDTAVETSVETGRDGDRRDDLPSRPVVAGVDQAFLDEQAVSAIVCIRDGEVVERVSAVTPLEFPYIPGLLSFREGGSILAAFSELESDPDLVCFDGSGRIHFREAGLATHIGVSLRVPTIGVAKRLLCGAPQGSLDGREVGTRVPIEADETVSAPSGTVIGYAVQTKQWERSGKINPLFVSPGHRVSAEVASEVVLAFCDGYKLPEPTRLADAYADEAKRALEAEAASE